MTMNPLPPQAYTKETLLKAYHWVQSQAPSIREMAITPDILVSLYLKASRDGDHSLERPSIQNFKSELKSLAGLMGELETPSVKPAFVSNPVPPVAQVSPPTPAPTAPASPSQTLISSMKEPLTAGVATAFPTLDARSVEALQETKKLFNLSSDEEALRMLIQIGFSKAKSLL